MMMTLASNIKEVREARNMSQLELAKQLDVHQTYVSMIERGLKLPSLEHLDHMADILECSTDRLLGRDIKYIKSERND